MPSSYGRRHDLPGYDKFKTGLAYRDVVSMLWSSSDDPKEWRRKSRGSVLGLWHRIKMSYYEEAVGRGLLNE
jgi:hypothetical protein